MGIVEVDWVIGVENDFFDGLMPENTFHSVVGRESGINRRPYLLRVIRVVQRAREVAIGESGRAIDRVAGGVRNILVVIELLKPLQQFRSPAGIQEPIQDGLGFLPRFKE